MSRRGAMTGGYHDIKVSRLDAMKHLKYDVDRAFVLCGATSSVWSLIPFLWRMA